MNNILSLSKKNDRLTIKYENTNSHVGVISLGDFTQAQSVLFNKINNMLTSIYNAGKEDVVMTQEQRNTSYSHFCLESIKVTKKKDYVFGGTFKVNKFTEYFPYAYAVPKEILPEVLENLKGEAYEVALLKQDISDAVVKLFQSFDIETLISIREIPDLIHGQLRLELDDHSEGLGNFLADIKNKTLKYD